MTAQVSRIALITILSDDVPRLAAFYRDVLGFGVKNDLGNYVELESENVRFSICARAIMADATHHPSFSKARGAGQSFELAFPVASPADVDRAFADIVAGGGQPVQKPADMPWKQRTAFFADPDGNIHEVFADLG